MIEDCVIIGGGVAGLSAANQLADAGMQPFIVEAGVYPAHRICGEFFSHECLPILHRWGIHLPEQIKKSRFFRGEKKVEFTLPIPAGSGSRFDFDTLLLDRARRNGARALTKTAVSSIQEPVKAADTYKIELSNGQTIEARHLIVGIGRLPKMLPKKHPIKPKYVGFKAHFHGIDLDQSVEIHCLNGGYLGFANIDANTTNVAGFVKIEQMPNSDGVDEFIRKLLNEKTMTELNRRFSKAQMVFPKWLTGQIPEFGIRENPSWERVLWVGDAAGSIPPVCGEGLAIAVTSGCMAADYLLKGQVSEFRSAWLKRYNKRFFWARQLHRLMLNPWLSLMGSELCRRMPAIAPYCWKLTREDF